MDTKKIIEKIDSMDWYHKIELAPGVVTPGYSWEHMWDPMLKYHRSFDFRGKRVLEVGCWDGYWSLEAEKLGAKEVWATDDVSQRHLKSPTVPFVIECLGSKINYRDNVSVYELDQHFNEEFEVVIFYGVLYHLHYPVLGLAKIRKLLKTGGTLLLETAVMLDTDEPIMKWGWDVIYPDARDTSVWNAPSIPCLKFLLETSYFNVEICETYLRQDERLKIGRAYAMATAVGWKDMDRHCFPDYFLSE